MGTSAKLNRRSFLAAGAVVPAIRISRAAAQTPRDSVEFSGNELSGNCYQKLVLPDADNPANIRCVLAESWNIGADGLTVTLNMRAGMVFASGNPVTAAGQ